MPRARSRRRDRDATGLLVPPKRTDGGFDRAAEIHAQAEQRQLEALDAGEREQLGALLRKLLVDLERREGAVADGHP